MIWSAPMILVGLTGGVATGKSTVAAMFRRCGATVIDADLLARQVVEPRKPAWREIVRTFGAQVLRPDRTLDRQALANIVFRSAPKLRRLERIIHPRVARLQSRLTRTIAERQPDAVVIYEVPLLFEAAVDQRVDAIIVVTADRRTQIARLARRTGLSRTDILRRIGSQMPLAEKRRRADFVLDGTQPLGNLRRQVARLYEQLRRRA
ncbi:MAG TPA: dephospho-CoA kinase [Nitrospiraceae bacterium]|nr:dephospho-CoA kinase [Nitrospiraceae bacterium]